MGVYYRLHTNYDNENLLAVEKFKRL